MPAECERSEMSPRAAGLCPEARVPTRSSSSRQTAYVFWGDLTTSSKGILGCQHKDGTTTPRSSEWQLRAQHDMKETWAVKVARAGLGLCLLHLLAMWGLKIFNFWPSISSSSVKWGNITFLCRFAVWTDRMCTCKLHRTSCILNKWELSIYSIWILKFAL